MFLLEPEDAQPADAALARLEGLRHRMSEQDVTTAQKLVTTASS